MNKTMTTMLTIAALTLASPAFAQDCEVTTSEPEVTAGDFYVDNDPCQPGCLISLWVYQESNGMPGLQRGDEVKDDTCNGKIEADTIIV